MPRKIQKELVDIIDAKLKNNGSAQLAIQNKDARKVMLFAAQACVGETEVGGNNRGKFVQLVQKTSDGYAGGEAWCMSFVQSMVAYAEVKTGVQSSLFTSEHCMTTWRKSKAADRVKKIPAPGAIIIWQKGSSESGHTGFVAEYLDKKMTTVEGNTGSNNMRDGDGVYSKTRSTKAEGTMKVVGFIIPFPLKDQAITLPELPGEPQGPITTGQDPDEGTVPWYKRMFAACKVDAGKESQLKNTLALIEDGFDRYLAVATLLGAPNKELFAWILGVIHFKEASCNFKGVLHNGERIIGTGKKTTIVPKGRGPFVTWEEAAVDAITLNGSRWAKLMGGSKDIGDILYALERYNGTGYITGAGKAETSPYLWACSNINDDKGKYVSDGKFDSEASTGSTSGAALILKEFQKAGKVQFSV